MAKLSDIAEAAAPLRADDLGETAYRRFNTEPDLLVLAVVDQDERPVGLLERNAFLLQMAAAYGRDLYARRPVSTLMARDPLVAEAETPAETFFNRVVESQPSALLKGFVIVRDGRYVGVGTALAVMRLSFALNAARAEEMTQLAENLAWAEAEANASSRAKSQFLAVMSHEIRTPLNGVLGLAEVVERRLAQPELKPYLRTMIDSGESLLRLLTDALDLSRAEAGVTDALNFREEPFCVETLFHDVQALWRARAEQLDLAFDAALDAAPEQWVLGDPVRLKQVLNNLLGNALKFTPAGGGVRVRLSAVRDDIHVRLTGEVADTGPGLPAELALRLFEPFAAGGGSGAGAGLGLSICRQIVHGMDGDISAANAPGGGAVFRFSVALYDVPAQPRTQEEAGPTQAVDGARVLIVDDNATNRLVASSMLKPLGFVCEEAVDGQDALERVRAAPFDIVLMDIKMPRMDGVAALRAVRALPWPVSDVPVVAVTANADPEDEKRYLASGFDAVARKPVQLAALLAAMDEAAGRRSEVQPAAA